MAMLREKTDVDAYATVLNQKRNRQNLLTTYIVTLCDGVISEIDLRNLLEAGLKIVRFKMTYTAKKDKIELLSMLKNALEWCCNKYDNNFWNVAVCIDLPNAIIRTGYLKDSEQPVFIKEGTVLEVTGDVEYWDQCDTERIFIDDPSTLNIIKPGTEISIYFGNIVMICTEVVNSLSIKCKVTVGGYLSHGQFVCVRGVKILKPALGKFDKQLLAFVKEYELDVVIVHCIRKAETLEKARSFFKGCHMPMILGAICEQEGLDNLDEIIAASDGIILAREFLAQSLLNDKQMVKVQMHVCAKCKEVGKPFFVSGNVLEETLKNGNISYSDMSDVTNAVLQGAGFVLRTYSDATNLLYTIKLLDTVCKVAESVHEQDNFWRFSLEMPPPVNAADGTILACAMTAKQTKSVLVVVLTVTGRTAVKLSRLMIDAAILCVSSDPRVAKQLQLYRGITSVVYDDRTKNWYEDMKARVAFAISYGLTHNMLRYNDSYVVLRKSKPFSAFCDQISMLKVVAIDNKRTKMECPY